MFFFLKKPLHSTELFKIFFSLLTLSTAFLQKACGQGKNHIYVKKVFALNITPILARIVKMHSLIVNYNTILRTINRILSLPDLMVHALYCNKALGWGIG